MSKTAIAAGVAMTLTIVWLVSWAWMTPPQGDVVAATIAMQRALIEAQAARLKNNCLQVQE